MVSTAAANRCHSGTEARQYGHSVVNAISTSRPPAAERPTVSESPASVDARNVGTYIPALGSRNRRARSAYCARSERCCAASTTTSTNAARNAPRAATRRTASGVMLHADHRNECPQEGLRDVTRRAIGDLHERSTQGNLAAANARIYAHTPGHRHITHRDPACTRHDSHARVQAGNRAGCPDL